MNGINCKDGSTHSPEAGGFERPSSPKPRIVNRTRQAVNQGKALYTHNLASVELQTKCVTSGGGMGGVETVRGPVPGQVLNYSSHAVDIIADSGPEGTESSMPLVAPSDMTLRPKSTVW